MTSLVTMLRHALALYVLSSLEFEQGGVYRNSGTVSGSHPVTQFVVSACCTRDESVNPCEHCPLLFQEGKALVCVCDNETRVN